MPAGAGACPANLSTTTTPVTCDAFPASPVESAWVELGSNNLVIARALTAATPADGGTNPCPSITLNGAAPQQMNLRAAATTSLPLRSTIVTPNKPSMFPVTSCEFRGPLRDGERRGGRAVLAAARGAPAKYRRNVNELPLPYNGKEGDAPVWTTRTWTPSWPSCRR